MTQRRSGLLARAAAAALAAFTLTTSQSAPACGGFFCSSSPVDQTAEHILFTINADHTVTAIVQISYSGDRDAFAWIVPVPGVPVLDASTPELVLNALAQATDPNYFKQQCSATFYDSAGTGGTTAAGGATGSTPPVTVLDQQVVGPYETVTLAATTATDLVDWLQSNQYRITDQMIPVLQPYIENGLHFVALRLQADRTAEDITPLTMTYQSDKPMIPIRLTRIAAQPEMGIVTWILSDRRWAPENYVDLKIDDTLIQFDPYGYQNNYLKIVSQEADKVGGQAFVTEYAKGTGDLVQQLQNQTAPTQQGEDARLRLLQLLQQFPYINRMYTRMSAEEMIGTDPTFVVASNQVDVSNVHDLTDPGFDYSQCYNNFSIPQPVPDPCFRMYCGRRGVCASTVGNVLLGIASEPACVCADDATARPTTTAYGTPMMYCEPVAMDLDGTATSGAADGGSTPLFVTACEGFSCGAHGECVGMNGNPTCHCEAGYGAVARQVYDSTTGTMNTTVTCESIGAQVLTLPRLPRIGQPNVYDNPGTVGATMPSASGGCAMAAKTRSRSAGAVSALLLGLSGFILRRRRRSGGASSGLSV